MGAALRIAKNGATLMRDWNAQPVFGGHVAAAPRARLRPPRACARQLREWSPAVLPRSRLRRDRHPDSLGRRRARPEVRRRGAARRGVCRDAELWICPERRASRAVGAAGARSSRDCARSSNCNNVPAMAETWKKLHDFEDIRYERTADGIAKITINRPEVRNAFRPPDGRRR